MRFYCVFGLLLTAITVCQAQEILVKDINNLPGAIQNENFTPFPYLACDGFAYFTIHDELGYELWRTDGTSQGTRRVKDINKGSQDAMGNLLVGGCVNGKLLFNAVDKAHGAELWVSDGTAEGTGLLKEITPGQLGSSLVLFENNGDKVAFLVQEDTSKSRRSDLWESDGTPEGTKFVKTLSTNVN